MKTLRLHIATSAKGDVFTAKDRFASNWDGEWWLATVKKVQSNGDCDISYDADGHTDTYPAKYMQGKNIIKLPAGTKKSQKSFTQSELPTDTQAGTSNVEVQTSTDHGLKIYKLQLKAGPQPIPTSFAAMFEIAPPEKWQAYQPVQKFGKHVVMKMGKTGFSPFKAIYTYGDTALIPTTNLEGMNLFKIPYLDEFIKVLLTRKLYAASSDSLMKQVALDFTREWVLAFSQDLPRIWAEYKDYNFQEYSKAPAKLYRGLVLSYADTETLMKLGQPIQLQERAYSSWATTAQAALIFAKGKINATDKTSKEKYDPLSSYTRAGIVIEYPSSRLDVFLNTVLIGNPHNLAEKEVIVRGSGVTTITPAMVKTVY